MREKREDTYEGLSEIVAMKTEFLGYDMCKSRMY